jgi:UDP-N-acetylmuramyl-tripeptide synthetase
MKKIYHYLKSNVLRVPFIFDRYKCKFIAVTGTDGKTTVSTLLYDMMKNEGLKVACFTTIGITYPEGFIDTGLHTTTLDTLELRKNLKKFKNYDFVILETTSHAIDQNRIAGLKFSAILYTNITEDHLDYHKTWDRYAYAKSKLKNYLTHSGFAVINMDDEKSFKYLTNRFTNINCYTYSVYNKNATIKAFNVTENSFDVKLENKTYSFKTKLFGEYNIQNSLLCIFTALKFDINESSIQKSLLYPPSIEGRFDVVSKKPLIIVDFAHTANAIYNILENLSVLKKNGKNRLITIFGAPGDRDKFKRPDMGKNASLFSDIIIITEDDPRFDNPKDIYTDIVQNIDTKLFKKNINLYQIDKRADAINFALKIARKNDIIAVLGKGHEKSLAIKGKEIPWSDKEFILKKIKNGK